MIELINISKSYDGVKVLDGVNMALPAGITCLMGASGIGKTTLAHLLAGLAAPDGGEIKKPANLRVAMVFQEDRLLAGLTALENVCFVVPATPAAEARAMELLTQAGLGDSLHKKAAELSGGMKRRVALCRALLAPHELLILDEPFKGLDEGIKPAVIAMVRQHAAEGARVVLCITHDPAEAAALGASRNTQYLTNQ